MPNDLPAEWCHPVERAVEKACQAEIQEARIGRMHRLPRPQNPGLQRLLDERDHVRIQLSMLQDAETHDSEWDRQLRSELADIENRIQQHKPEKLD